MAVYDLVVLNGLVVTEERTGEFDIAVADGKISKVVPRGQLSEDNAKRYIDAEGGLVMVRDLKLYCRRKHANCLVQPGGIDTHVHLGQ